MAIDADVTIGMNTSPLQASVNKAIGITKRMRNTIKTSMSDVGRDIAGAFLGREIITFTKGSIEAAAAAQGMQQSLAAVMGSAEFAANELERLREAAKLPGLDFENAVKGSARLQSLGLGASEARDFLTELGNVSAVSGLNSYDYGEILDAIVDIGSAGEITDEKIDRLTERSAILSKVLKDTFGASTAKGIREMGVTADEFIEKLTAGLKGVERASGDSLANQLKNSNDQIKQLSASLGTALMPAVERALEGMDKLLTGTSSVWKSIEGQLNTVSAMMSGVSYKEALQISHELEAQDKKNKAAAEAAAAAKEAEAKAARDAARSVPKGDTKKKEGAEFARRVFETETRIMELRNSGSRAAAKQADEMEKQLKIAQLQEQIMKQQNVDAAEALELAKRRVNAEDPKKSGRIKGYTQDRNKRDMFGGLNSQYKRDTWGELQESTSKFNQLQSSTSPFDALKGRGSILQQKAQSNAAEKAAPPKSETEATLKSIDEKMSSLVGAVEG